MRLSEVGDPELTLWHSVFNSLSISIYGKVIGSSIDLVDDLVYSSIWISVFDTIRNDVVFSLKRSIGISYVGNDFVVHLKI